MAGQPWNSYPRLLGRLLGNDYCVGNFGYTNRTAINTADYPYTAEKLYTKSLEFKPDIVLIMLGSNDTKEINWDPDKYIQDMGNLIETHDVFIGRKDLFVDGCHIHRRRGSRIPQEKHVLIIRHTHGD